MSKFLSIMLTKAELKEAWDCCFFERVNVTESLRKDKNDASYKKAARLLDSILNKFMEATDE